MFLTKVRGIMKFKCRLLLKTWKIYIIEMIYQYKDNYRKVWGKGKKNKSTFITFKLLIITWYWNSLNCWSYVQFYAWHASYVFVRSIMFIWLLRLMRNNFRKLNLKFDQAILDFIFCKVFMSCLDYVTRKW